jgi:hypothetical protein
VGRDDLLVVLGGPGLAVRDDGFSTPLRCVRFERRHGTGALSMKAGPPSWRRRSLPAATYVAAFSDPMRRLRRCLPWRMKTQ